MGKQTRREKGSGTLTKLGPNKYLVRFTIPATPGEAARRRSKVVHGTKAQAASLLTAWSNEVKADAEKAAEELAPRSRMLLDPYVRFYFFPDLDRRVAERDRMRARTASEYKKVAKSRVLPVLGHRRTSDLRASDADVLARALLAQGLKPSTVRRAMDVLKLIVRLAESDGVCPPGTADSMRPWLPEPKVQRPRLTPAEADRVTELLLAEAQANPQPPAAVLPALLVATLGIRRGEACGAQRSAWNAENRTLTIACSMTELPTGELVPEEPKSENGHRVLPVPPQVADVIDAFLARRPFSVYLAEPVRAPLGTPVRPSRLSTYLRTKVRQAGLPDEVSGAHAFRRSVADRLLASGADTLLTGRFLGHADGRLVETVYGGKQADRVIGLADVLALPQRAADAQREEAV